MFFRTGIIFTVDSLLTNFKLKTLYFANIIHYFIFVFFLYFFYHFSFRKDQFTVLSLKFGTQDFTDPCQEP